MASQSLGSPPHPLIFTNQKMNKFFIMGRNYNFLYTYWYRNPVLWSWTASMHTRSSVYKQHCHYDQDHDQCLEENLGDENHLWAVVRVGAHTELTPLNEKAWLWSDILLVKLPIQNSSFLTCWSRGNLSKDIGQMKLIWVDWAKISY